MTAICVPIFLKAGMGGAAAVPAGPGAAGGEGAAGGLEALFDEIEEVLDGAGGVSRGGGMVELRCDTATPRLMLEAIECAHLPVIVTVRPTWEGGGCDKDDEYRVGLWEAAMEAGVEYVDVELAAWERSKMLRDRVCEAAEKSGTKIILSTHAFEGKPKDLEARITRLRRIKQADVLKIAWKAATVLDGIDALKLQQRLRREDGRPAVVLAMGEEGMISRLLARKFDAAFTFATLTEGAQTAPGQPTVEQLRNTYRWDHQRADTPVYAVAGWPVAQSRSPALHNAGFDALGVPGVYVPLPIRPGSLPTVLDALREVPTMNLRGVSVTMPHKEAAFKYVCDRMGKIDDLSWRIGVLNTLIWDEGAAVVRGLNSDYEGALDALVTAWNGQRGDLAGKRVAVLGAGGAARAVVAGLVTHGASVVVYNRTRERADTLAADFADSGAVITADWANLRNADCDAFINCTPLGMHPHAETCPLVSPPGTWSAATVVFDTVYSPPLTRLLKLARETGARTVAGTEMFLRQAAVQFREFTGQAAPLEEFRRIFAPGAN